MNLKKFKLFLQLTSKSEFLFGSKESVWYNSLPFYQKQQVFQEKVKNMRITQNSLFIP